MSVSLRCIALIVLMPILLRGDDEDAAWSRPVGGLKARLFISPLKKGDDHHAHFTLFFQLQHDSRGWGNVEIDYKPERLTLTLLNQDGKVTAWNSVAGNRPEGPRTPLVLPQNAFLSFPIGNTMWQRSGAFLGEYIAFYDNFNEWMIPPHSAKAYYLTGEFNIPPAPRDLSNPNFVWSGKLILPKVQIPQMP